MLFSILQFLKYYFISITKFKVHSPFVFDFIHKVLEKELEQKKYSKVKNLLKLYSESDLQIENKEDFGAGSRVNSINNYSIKHLLTNVATSKKYGKILHNIVNNYNFKNCIELGTSLGIGTVYISNETNMVTSIEGNSFLANLSEANLKKISPNNIEIVNNKFDNVLEAILIKDKFDFLFIDGNHREEATLKYFEMALKYKNENSVIIFDDINWSKGMNNAWNKIISNKEVILSIDLYKFGIIFFNKSFKVKEHFILWY